MEEIVDILRNFGPRAEKEAEQGESGRASVDEDAASDDAELDVSSNTRPGVAMSSE